jgi:hypothetical protein
MALFFFFHLEPGYHYVAQAGLELTILLPQLPMSWDLITLFFFFGGTRV